jgi:mRNA-degrading endonuclease toxin of MazEF toxin-antitoxin module
MGAKRKIICPNRGEIYLVSFDPTIGAEIQKTRPALIIQNFLLVNFCLFNLTKLKLIP